jgi:hypothetical protein
MELNGVQQNTEPPQQEPAHTGASAAAGPAPADAAVYDAAVDAVIPVRCLPSRPIGARHADAAL